MPTSTAAAYLLGNPVLNPGVLAFLAIVGPWQWVATRLLLGSALVFGVSALVARMYGRTASSDPISVSNLGHEQSLVGSSKRFLRSLGRLSAILVPEYFVLVLVFGAVQGWLFPLGAPVAHWGVLAVVVAAVLGTLMVLPTAGEIPVVLGMVAMGFGPGVIGALLITLPALSLPSMVMVARSLTPRVTVSLGVAVAGTGIGAGAFMSLLM